MARQASVRVMAKATLPMLALKLAATSRNTKAMMKKSKASSVQPR